MDFSKLSDIIHSFVDTGSVPGCAVSIVRGGKVLFEDEAGMSDVASGRPVTVHSMYRQASTTKLYTYAIMGMLYERGKFLWSDPVGAYLPEWKHPRVYKINDRGDITAEPAQNPISIRNAVSMMCGLPYCMVPSASPNTPTLRDMSERIAALKKEQPFPALRDEVRAMADVPLMFEPGTHWLYGFGSEITGAIVETLTDMPLREAFRRFLIEPLELEDTDTWITPENRSRVVTSYAKKGPHEFVPASDMFDASMDPAKAPVGARPNLVTSAHDFAVFMDMLANGGTSRGRRFLAPGTVAMLHENQLGPVQTEDFTSHGTNAYDAGYGYGLGFRTLLTRAYGHNGHLGCFGWTGGSGTWGEADPEAKAGIAYMHNMMPNEQLYHHMRVRTGAYGCLTDDE